MWMMAATLVTVLSWPASTYEMAPTDRGIERFIHWPTERACVMGSRQLLHTLADRVGSKIVIQRLSCMRVHEYRSDKTRSS